MDAKATLLSALPIVLILVALAAAVLFFPESVELRFKAAEPRPTPTIAPAFPTPTPTSLPVTTVCSILYQPVCGADNQTYASGCEAGLQGIPVVSSGPCP